MRRDLVLNIEADESAFTTRQARREANLFERELAKLERQQARVDRALTSLGRGMLVAGAAIAAGVGLAVKAAIDWESSWAGVLKTVEGTDAQMAALEEDIRGLTAVLPASHAEIAAVAEAAGQLGIQRENVAAFTKTMIDMGEATNLTSDAAATALARLMNIMQTAPADVDRLASAVVDLGNKGATTEAEIVEMALRIAGAGRTIGLTEQQVVGFAAALSNVGINAEAGGTAISRVFLEIDTAVSEGGAKLEVFARTAGLSADEFARAYEQDAGTAIARFVAGLAKVQSSGGDVNAVLRELGITEIRTSDALRRLAGSGDNLTQSLQIGNQAWQENTALVDEANRRYQTAEARIQIARNQINEAAIDLGGTFLPVVAEMADTVAGFTGAIADLPEPLRNALAILAAVTAAVLLAGGTALIAVPKIHAFNLALEQMAAKGGRAALASTALQRSVSGIGLALGPVTAALVALDFASRKLEQAIFDELNPAVDAMTVGLAKFEETGKLSGEIARVLGDDLSAVGDEFEILLNDRWWDKLGRGAQDFLDKVPGQFGSTMLRLGRDLEVPREKVEALDQALATMARAGSTEQAEAAFARLTAEMGLTTHQTELLRGQLDEWRGAAEVGAAAAEDVAAGIGEVGTVAEQAAEDVDALREAFDLLFGAQMSLDRATIAYKEGFVELVAELEEGTRTLDLNTQAGRDNRGVVLDQIDVIEDLRAANIDNGMSIDDANALYDTQLDKIEAALIKRGFEEEGVRDLIDSYRAIPDAVSTTVSTPGMEQAEAAAKRLREQLDNIDRFVRISFEVSGTAAVGAIRVPRFQHGGEVPGPFGESPDRRLIAATPKEIVLNPQVSQRYRADLLALNATGRWPVTGRGPAGSAGAGNGVTQHVENLNVTTLTSQFSTKQVFQDLAMHGVS
jgi:TP901 family phage tail tape measure protein